MAKVKTECLQPGMVAGADVRNMDGMLLMPSGCELSDRHIRILKTWGVAEITVGQSAEEAAAAPRRPISAKPTPELIKAVKARFWQLDETNPVHEEILRLMLRRKTKSIPAA
jgi:hypothetical protein